MDVDRLLADWGGSAFAAASIVFLFRKSIWYWYASLGANALWFYLFVETSTHMVAGLQVSYAIFAVYGIARWRRERAAAEPSRAFDHAGTAIALGISRSPSPRPRTAAGRATWSSPPLRSRSSRTGSRP